ncbi:DUF6192 family protein [Streptomyces kanamyceticus]|uniref:RacO protein n=1 Tax=Streptomyces kanamyceticus TaxID=1967 RepID=A0A5J6GFY3_STRKN|nr:DUF6192 family protein [Streptomyces kanamyceticus]QEU93372.1 hypothetical protein CP970_22830 [Streptomyces kanamyceticus]
MTTIEVPSGYTREEWTGYVRRGRHAVRANSASNFELGDIDNEMLHKRPLSTREMGRIRVLFARQIGVDVALLAKYGATARAWPIEKRRPDVPWSVHRRLNALPNRFELLQGEPSDDLDPDHQGKWTYNMALRAANSRPQSPTTPDERVSQAKYLLRSTDDAATAVTQLADRTEVMKKAVEDPAFRRAVRDANRERGERIERGIQVEPSAPPAAQADGKPAQEPSRQAAQPPVTYRESPTAVLKILGQCTSFCVSMQSAVVLVQEEMLSTEEEIAVLDSIKRVRAICDWCEHVVTTGQGDMDEELVRLLDGMDGGGS